MKSIAVILTILLCNYILWQFPTELRCHEAERLATLDSPEILLDYRKWDKYVSRTKGLQLWHPKSFIVTETAGRIRVEKPGLSPNFVDVQLIKKR